jgi:hypothetical protein
MTTMPLASWLSGAYWRMDKLPGRDPKVFSTVLEAARTLEQHVFKRLEIKLLFCDDPWMFREMVVAEQYNWVVPAGRGPNQTTWPVHPCPLLGTHTDPTCRALSKDTFYALIGTKTDRPLPLFTTNTACRYDLQLCVTPGELFTTRRLWSDHPERDCADLAVTVEDAAEWMQIVCHSLVHVGTAWVRDDKRGNKIMRDLVRLHRMVAWLRWGLPIFGTILKKHADTFRTDLGQCIGRVIERRGEDERDSVVTLYDPQSVIADAHLALSGKQATSPP